MENNLICRNIICMDEDKEKGKYLFHFIKYDFLEQCFLEFLCEILEILLYILLPDEDFQCKPLRYVLREIFANCVVLPLFTMLSDPDYINQAIIWLVNNNFKFLIIFKSVFFSVYMMLLCQVKFF